MSLADNRLFFIIRNAVEKNNQICLSVDVAILLIVLLQACAFCVSSQKLSIKMSLEVQLMQSRAADVSEFNLTATEVTPQSSDEGNSLSSSYFAMSTSLNLTIGILGTGFIVFLLLITKILQCYRKFRIFLDENRIEAGEPSCSDG